MPLDRRAFNRLVLLSAAGLILPRRAYSRSAAQSGQSPPAPVTLASYVDPLPIPPRLSLSGSAATPVTMRMGAFRQKVHRDLPPTTLWGYNSSWPGPTIDVKRGQPFSVSWINKLPRQPLLPLDFTVHGEEQSVPPVRAVVHLHGAQVLPESDGYPDAWTTPDGKKGAFQKAGPNHFPNAQPASTLWYHDHAIGITRLNVYAGLAGFYFIRDEQEAALNLPSGAYEIPLMLQDRLFLPDGSLLYPAAVNGTHPVWIQEFFGNNICVNGKVKPYLEVEPRKYRFRMVNASNARFYHLALRPSSASGTPTGDSANAPPFQQIGADQGRVRERHCCRSLP